MRVIWRARFAGILIPIASFAFSITASGRVNQGVVAPASSDALVTVAFSVIDRENQPVEGLGRDDFVVSDEGVPQPIVGFTAGPSPISVGILIDASLSMVPGGEQMADTALGLLINRLANEDEVFLAEFAEKYRQLQTWTSDRTVFTDAPGRIRGGRGTALFDAVEQAVQMAVRGKQTRKALVVVSDGEDSESRVSRRQVRNSIRRGDVTVYALGLDTGNPLFRVDRGALRDLTEDSGGRVEIVHNLPALTDVVTRIVHELRNQYVITYAAPRGHEGEWREIRIQALPGDLRIRARRGYVVQ